MRAAFASFVLAGLLGLVAASAGAGTSEGQSQAIAMRPDLGRAILAEVNALRAAKGLRPLRPSVALGRAAQTHSLDMAAIGFFSHDSGNGADFTSRIRRFYPSRGFRAWRVGENLAWRSPDMDSRQAVRLWLSSPRHREILLAPDWREAGLAAVHAEAAGGDYAGRAVTIVTANFGARSR